MKRNMQEAKLKWSGCLLRSRSNDHEAAGESPQAMDLLQDEDQDLRLTELDA